MSQSIREIMTPDPVVQSASASLVEAARFMRDSDVGDVLVERDGKLCGILTDRDIVVRAVADDRRPSEVQLGEICSPDLKYLTPDDTVDSAVAMIREHALRRVPVCEDGRAVGIVSIGDLAVELDRDSALADVSAAPPNN